MEDTDVMTRKALTTKKKKKNHREKKTAELLNPCRERNVNRNNNRPIAGVKTHNVTVVVTRREKKKGRKNLLNVTDEKLKVGVTMNCVIGELLQCLPSDGIKKCNCKQVVSSQGKKKNVMVET